MHSRHNCDSWRHAIREALDHVRYFHKPRAMYETEALEALYALPAAAREATP
jgi:hypothetical protein